MTTETTETTETRRADEPVAITLTREELATVLRTIRDLGRGAEQGLASWREPWVASDGQWDDPGTPARMLALNYLRKCACDKILARRRGAGVVPPPSGLRGAQP